MALFVLSFVVIGLAAIGMATGVLLGGDTLKGTCATLDSGAHACLSCDTCPFRKTRRSVTKRETDTQVTELQAGRTMAT